MTRSIHSATAQLQRAIPESEAGIEDALLNVSQLFAAMVEARKETGVAAGTGHAALLHMLRVQEALVTASGEMAKAHHKMLTLGREVCGGDLEECPPKAAANPLRRVA